jgi:hypothetical protein
MDFACFGGLTDAYYGKNQNTISQILAIGNCATMMAGGLAPAVRMAGMGAEALNLGISLSAVSLSPQLSSAFSTAYNLYDAASFGLGAAGY